jgi:SOS-response transcriptional repressor LexA
MNNISQRVRDIRRELGLSQDDFAKLIKYTRTHVSLVVRGKSEPSPRFVSAIEILEAERRAKKGATEMKESALKYTPEMNANLAEGVRMIPLISWAQAGIAASFEEIPEHWQEKIPVPVKDKEAFAIRLRGDSMEPKFSEGDVVTVLPGTAARNGDLVVANIKEEGFAFKVLNLVGGDPRLVKLTSYNSSVYAPMEYPREKFHWIYPVHSVTKTFRR